MVLEDLAWKGFNCRDLRWNLFVFTPNALPCTRHQSRHDFHLVDFGVIDRIPANEKDRKNSEKEMWEEHLHNLSFWGICP